MDNFEEAKQNGLIAVFDFLRVFPAPQDVAEAVSKLKVKVSSQ